jgi:hypothetical protein
MCLTLAKMTQGCALNFFIIEKNLPDIGKHSRRLSTQIRPMETWSSLNLTTGLFETLKVF